MISRPSDPAASTAVTLALVPALLLPFASLPVFAFGQSDRAEPLVIAAHAVAALASLTMAWQVWRGHRPVDLASLLPPVVMAIWSMGTGLWHGQVLPVLMGAPQSGLGALWYLDLAAWLALAMLAAQYRMVWRRLTVIAAFSAIAVASLVLYGQLTDRPPLIFIPSYYGWLALGLPPVLLCHGGGRLWRWRVALIGVATLLLLIASQNLTLGVAMVGGLGYAALSWRWSWLGQRWLGMSVLVLALVMPFITVASGIASTLGASMHARALVAQIALARLSDEPSLLLWGLGWGRMSDVFATHLAAVQAPLWDRSGWDFLRRDYFHSHNLLIEATLSAGIPGLLLAAAIPAVLVWRAPAHRRGFVVAFAAAWLLGLGFWFELAFALPVFAFAAVALCRLPQEVPRSGRNSVLTACFGGLGLLQIAVAALLIQQGAQIETAKAWLARPTDSAPLWRDWRGDDKALAALVSTAMEDIRWRGSQGALDVPADIRRLTWLIDLLSSRIPQTLNPLLPVAGDGILAEVVLNPTLSSLTAAFTDRLALWPVWLDRGLSLAPRRSDLPIGYMSWRFAAGDTESVLLWARRLRMGAADDPVGLYFEGGVYALHSDADARQRGLMLLRRSLDQGIERYIQLDAGFRAMVENASR